ncbi:MAG: DNA-directed RNA polymerase subunit beta, partial [Burkholderiaceae bacterium]|nr:DNA-directed RNA polymerase subunit beta [Burkholderiaceae bacterium]
MSYSLTERKRIRKSFAKRATVQSVPFLLATQLDSYAAFLQANVPPHERKNEGLQAAFNSIFPIVSHSGNARLEFVSYQLGEPPFDVKECQQRGLTYASPLRAKVRLVILDKDAPRPTPKEVKEQEVYMGEIPLMTRNGTFIINGTERVIVSQLHRSPGVFFEKLPAQNYFLGKIIPYRGSWVEFEYDNKNLLYVRIDRKRKFYGTVFLRALGMKSDSEILKAFYRITTLSLRDRRIFWKVDESLVGMKLAQAITSKSGETIHPAHRKVRETTIEALRKAKIDAVEVTTADLEGAWVASDVIDMETGEILAEANQELTSSRLAQIMDAGIPSIEVFFPERDDVGVVISATLKKDPIKTPNEALMEIYKKLRPGDPPTLDTAQQLFHGMFFDPRKYDFSRVGRMKFNIKIYDNPDYAPEGWLEQQRRRRQAGEPYVSENPLDRRTLDRQDFIDTIRYLLRLRKGIGTVDDIDHLGNRRVRAVGELLENQFRIGLVRMERAIKEKMAVYQEMSTAMPHDLVNAKPVMAAIREFFGSSQLSQFMDQTNPLSEITHKRRLSALGPGGLSRERAGFEVRDVHPTHYG